MGKWRVNHSVTAFQQKHGIILAKKTINLNHNKMDHSKMNMNKEEHVKMQSGKAPMGMEGHDHHKMMIADFRRRFYVTVIITIPVMILSLRSMVQPIYFLPYQQSYFFMAAGPF
jgi:cation transport ATPase